jgi:hypothetical protein
MRLDHRLGSDDGFWMSYSDFLRHLGFITFHKVFGEEWQTCQLWAAFKVPWSQDTLEDTFQITLTAATSIYIVLSRLDSSYFRGLEGQYEFELGFTLSEADGTYVAHAER